MLGSRSESRAIDFAHPNVRVHERLGNMPPYRFGAFAMAAPWRIEHQIPLTFVLYVDKTIAQFQHSRPFYVVHRLTCIRREEIVIKLAANGCLVHANICTRNTHLTIRSRCMHSTNSPSSFRYRIEATTEQLQNG